MKMLKVKLSLKVTKADLEKVMKEKDKWMLVSECAETRTEDGDRTITTTSLQMSMSAFCGFSITASQTNGQGCDGTRLDLIGSGGYMRQSFSDTQDAQERAAFRNAETGEEIVIIEPVSDEEESFVDEGN